VLRNLLSNAVKFTADGSVELAVAVVRATPADVTVEFSVTDTGPGVPHAARERIFRKYERTGGGGRLGTGLGLKLSLGLVHLMGGSIEVESPWQAGRSGARFFFWGVFGRAPPPPPTPSTPSTPTCPPLPPRLRVLVADDQRYARVVLRAMLARVGGAGWTVEEAETAEAAVARVRERSRPLDVVFMDENFMRGNNLPWDLPGQETMGTAGTEATRAIRAFDRRVLIVGCTGSESLAHNAKAVEAGQDAVLGKPIREADVTSVLSELLAKKRR
jgi:CheY-like chemotaxis protein